ncbi:MAG: hypothetical protein M3Z00_10745 [Actinomycetota bacterium]|nr:hypothetical protein [Actinomycetota bacterium]
MTVDRKGAGTLCRAVDVRVTVDVRVADTADSVAVRLRVVGPALLNKLVLVIAPRDALGSAGTVLALKVALGRCADDLKAGIDDVCCVAGGLRAVDDVPAPPTDDGWPQPATAIATASNAAATARTLMTTNGSPDVGP